MAGAITPPNTVSQLSHAITITVNGTTIGAINEWNPKQTRTITELYELADGSTGGFGPGVGVPFEKVPGNVSGMQIDVRRYDLYTLQMEQAFTALAGAGTTGRFGGDNGGSAVDMNLLSDQLSSFEVREMWKKPDNTAYVYRYQGCWFSDLGRTISATSDRIINVNATLQFTRRVKTPA